MMTEFKPRIICFLCNWCSYAGADLAGVSRIQYPSTIRVIRVMCSGRVDPSLVLTLLAEGVDGIMIMGCHIGDCHYISGNLHATRKFTFLKRLLALTGLNPERVTLEWVSASEGTRFAHLIRQFTERMRELGSSPLSEDPPNPKLFLNIQAAKAVTNDFRLRALVGKEEKLKTEENIYGERLTEEEFDDVITVAVESEYTRRRIQFALLEKPTSVKSLAEELGLDPSKILQHIVTMRKKGWIDIQEIQGRSPIYKVVEVSV